jgi:RimJ/RimL family protein N-acetyltransferase
VTSTYFLESDRLGFRPWRPDDVDLAVALWADPEVARFITTSPPTPEDAEARLARELASQAEHGFAYWPIFLRESGEHVGCCGLRPYQPGQPELGVHVRPPFWRRGLAREAAQAVIRHAFDQLGARALFAGHNPKNEASRALLLALGFDYTHDERYPPTGLMHPSYRLTPRR